MEVQTLLLPLRGLLGRRHWTHILPSTLHHQITSLSSQHIVPCSAIFAVLTTSYPNDRSACAVHSVTYQAHCPVLANWFLVLHYVLYQRQCFVLTMMLINDRYAPSATTSCGTDRCGPHCHAYRFTTLKKAPHSGPLNVSRAHCTMFHTTPFSGSGTRKLLNVAYK